MQRRQTDILMLLVVTVRKIMKNLKIYFGTVLLTFLLRSIWAHGPLIKPSKPTSLKCELNKKHNAFNFKKKNIKNSSHDIWANNSLSGVFRMFCICLQVIQFLFPTWATVSACGCPWLWWDSTGISISTGKSELPCEQSQHKMFTVQAIWFCALIDYVLKAEVVIYEI